MKYLIILLLIASCSTFNCDLSTEGLTVKQDDQYYFSAEVNKVRGFIHWGRTTIVTYIYDDKIDEMVEVKFFERDEYPKARCHIIAVLKKMEE